LQQQKRSFAVAVIRLMIERLGTAAGSVCLAWTMTGFGMAGAQPWEPRVLDELSL